MFNLRLLNSYLSKALLLYVQLYFMPHFLDYARQGIQNKNYIENCLTSGGQHYIYRQCCQYCR